MTWLHVTPTEQKQLIENSPCIPTITELTSFPGPSPRRSHSPLGWRASAPPSGNVSICSLHHTPHSSLGWGLPASRVSPSLLGHLHHCTNFPGNLASYKELSVSSTSPPNFNIFYLLSQQHFCDELSIFTHSTSSPPLLFVTLLNLTAVLTLLKAALTWLLPGCLWASLVITLFLFILLDISAVFDRMNHFLLLKTFSSSASPPYCWMIFKS